MTDKNIGVHVGGPEDRVVSGRTGKSTLTGIIFDGLDWRRTGRYNPRFTKGSNPVWYKNVVFEDSVHSEPTYLNLASFSSESEAYELEAILRRSGFSTVQSWTERGLVDRMPCDVYRTFCEYVIPMLRNPAYRKRTEGRSVWPYYAVYGGHYGVTPAMTGVPAITFSAMRNGIGDVTAQYIDDESSWSWGSYSRDHKGSYYFSDASCLVLGKVASFYYDVASRKFITEAIYSFCTSNGDIYATDRRYGTGSDANTLFTTGIALPAPYTALEVYRQDVDERRASLRLPTRVKITYDTARLAEGIIAGSAAATLYFAGESLSLQGRVVGSFGANTSLSIYFTEYLRPGSKIALLIKEYFRVSYLGYTGNIGIFERLRTAQASVSMEEADASNSTIGIQYLPPMRQFGISDPTFAYIETEVLGTPRKYKVVDTGYIDFLSGVVDDGEDEDYQALAPITVNPVSFVSSAWYSRLTAEAFPFKYLDAAYSVAEGIGFGSSFLTSNRSETLYYSWASDLTKYQGLYTTGSKVLNIPAYTTNYAYSLKGNGNISSSYIPCGTSLFYNSDIFYDSCRSGLTSLLYWNIYEMTEIVSISDQGMSVHMQMNPQIEDSTPTSAGRGFYSSGTAKTAFGSVYASDGIISRYAGLPIICTEDHHRTFSATDFFIQPNQPLYLQLGGTQSRSMSNQCTPVSALMLRCPYKKPVSVASAQIGTSANLSNSFSNTSYGTKKYDDYLYAIGSIAQSLDYICTDGVQEQQIASLSHTFGTSAAYVTSGRGVYSGGDHTPLSGGWAIGDLTIETTLPEYSYTKVFAGLSGDASGAVRLVNASTFCIKGGGLVVGGVRLTPVLDTPAIDTPVYPTPFSGDLVKIDNVSAYRLSGTEIVFNFVLYVKVRPTTPITYHGRDYGYSYADAAAYVPAFSPDLYSPPYNENTPFWLIMREVSGAEQRSRVSIQRTYDTGDNYSTGNAQLAGITADGEWIFHVCTTTMIKTAGVPSSAYKVGVCITNEDGASTRRSSEWFMVDIGGALPERATTLRNYSCTKNGSVAVVGYTAAGTQPFTLTREFSMSTVFVRDRLLYTNTGLSQATVVGYYEETGGVEGGEIAVVMGTSIGLGLDGTLMYSVHDTIRTGILSIYAQLTEPLLSKSEAVAFLGVVVQELSSDEVPGQATAVTFYNNLRQALSSHPSDQPLTKETIYSMCIEKYMEAITIYRNDFASPELIFLTSGLLYSFALLPISAKMQESYSAVTIIK